MPKTYERVFPDDDEEQATPPSSPPLLSSYFQKVRQTAVDAFAARYKKNQADKSQEITENVLQMLLANYSLTPEEIATLRNILQITLNNNWDKLYVELIKPRINRLETNITLNEHYALIQRELAALITPHIKPRNYLSLCFPRYNNFSIQNPEILQANIGVYLHGYTVDLDANNSPPRPSPISVF